MAIHVMLSDKNNLEQILKAAEAQDFKLKSTNFVSEKGKSQVTWWTGVRARDDSLFIFELNAVNDVASFCYDNFVFRKDDGFTTGQLFAIALKMVTAEVKKQRIRIRTWNPIFLRYKERNTRNFVGGGSLTLDALEAQRRVIKPTRISSR